MTARQPRPRRDLPPAPDLTHHALALASDKRVQAAAISVAAIAVVVTLLPAVAMFVAVLAAIRVAKALGWLG